MLIPFLLDELNVPVLLFFGYLSACKEKQLLVNISWLRPSFNSGFTEP
jgi:hypothetical protein